MPCGPPGKTQASLNKVHLPSGPDQIYLKITSAPPPLPPVRDGLYGDTSSRAGDLSSKGRFVQEKIFAKHLGRGQSNITPHQPFSLRSPPRFNLTSQPPPLFQVHHCPPLPPGPPPKYPPPPRTGLNYSAVWPAN
jgi:hypothetical protein